MERTTPYRGEVRVSRKPPVDAAWDPLAVTVESIGAVSDDRVVSVVKGVGELRSGGPASYGAAHVFTVCNGKVVAFQEYVGLDKALA